MEKHYDSTYLSTTYGKLKEIKSLSYEVFKHANTLIDLGCGNGIDVENMSIIYPEKNIYGVDHDANLIDECNQRISEKHTNTYFKVGDASQLPFDNHTINGVRAERLFQHLENPKSVLIEIRRVLQKEGVLQVLETDWSSINLYNTPDKLAKRIYDYYVNTMVKNGTICKLLIPLINEANYSDLKIEVFSIKIDEYKQACELIKLNTILKEMKTNKKISRNEYDSIINNYSTIFCLKMNMVQFTAKVD